MCPQRQFPTNEERDENRFHPDVTENPPGGLHRRPDIRPPESGFWPQSEFDMIRIQHLKENQIQIFLDWVRNKE